MARISFLKPLLFVVAGVLFLLVGLMVLPIPGIPETPFLVLALGCFCRASNRFAGWLFRQRYMQRLVTHLQSSNRPFVQWLARLFFRVMGIAMSQNTA